MKAAQEYAYSDEIFEHVCLKFLSTNNNLALLKNLLLVYNLRMKNSEESGNDNNSSFIEKYLVNTFLFETLIGIYENKKSKDFFSIIKDKRKDKDYFDTLLLYYILNIYGKNKEFLELATLKEDYEEIILHLINQKRINESLVYFNLYLINKQEEIIKILISPNLSSIAKNKEQLKEMLNFINFYKLKFFHINKNEKK